MEKTLKKRAFKVEDFKNHNITSILYEGMICPIITDKTGCIMYSTANGNRILTEEKMSEERALNIDGGVLYYVEEVEGGFSKLEDFMKKYSNMPVRFMVHHEVCGSDDYLYWGADIESVSVGYYGILGGERVISGCLEDVKDRLYEYVIDKFDLEYPEAQIKTKEYLDFYMTTGHVYEAIIVRLNVC